MKTYKELIVWQKSVDLVEEVYFLTSKFPKTEIYVLTSQVRRAAISIPSNIAESFGRKSRKERLQFYLIAYGSTLELETQLLIAKRLKFISEVDSKRVVSLLDEILRMLNKMTSEARSNY